MISENEATKAATVTLKHSRSCGLGIPELDAEPFPSI